MSSLKPSILISLLVLTVYLTISSDTVFGIISESPFVKKLSVLSVQQKFLGIGTAFLVIFLSATTLRPNLRSLISKGCSLLLPKLMPSMLNKTWSSKMSSQRMSKESRLALKNGGEIGGLSNEGNTCFMNSVLQSLASSTTLLQFFNDNIHEITEVDANGEVTQVSTGQVKSGMRFTAALKSLLDDLNGAYGSRGREFSTRSLLKKMPDGPKQNFFLGYNQEDAQEFYQSVMRIVEKEYKNIHSSKNLESSEPSASKEKFVSASSVPNIISGFKNLGTLGTVYVPAHQIDPNVPDSDDLLAPFQLVTPVDGISAERIGCINCGETGGIRYSVNSGLSLNLPYDRSYGTEYELTNLLREWKKPEIIDDVNCNRCGLLQTKEFLLDSLKGSCNEKLASNIHTRVEEINIELEKDYISDEVFDKLTTKQMIRKTSKSKQILLSRPPPLLCIHINRSVMDPNTFMIMKNSKNLSFPSVLDLNEFAAEPSDINIDARLPFRKQDVVTTSSASIGEEGDEVVSTSVLVSTASDVSQNCASLPQPNLRYQLKAVISHMGTHNYGHYICYRRFRGTWWKANDEAIYTATEQEVLASPGTFMLFYELQASSSDERYSDSGNEEDDDEEKGSDNKESETESSAASSVLDNDRASARDSSSWVDSYENQEDSSELFPNAKFELGEERAYHV